MIASWDTTTNAAAKYISSLTVKVVLFIMLGLVDILILFWLLKRALVLRLLLSLVCYELGRNCGSVNRTLQVLDSDYAAIFGRLSLTPLRLLSLQLSHLGQNIIVWKICRHWED